MATYVRIDDVVSAIQETAAQKQAVDATGSVVEVWGRVETQPCLATARNESQRTVSTTAVRLCGVNAARKSIAISNNSTGNLYVASTSDVTSSGAGMGHLVGPSGVYTDSGDGIWPGELWGIYSASASSPNVVVTDSS